MYWVVHTGLAPEGPVLYHFLRSSIRFPGVDFNISGILPDDHLSDDCLLQGSGSVDYPRYSLGCKAHGL